MPVYTTKPIEEDGYYEIHLSLTARLSPLMKCRAVKTQTALYPKGKYLAVVRDFNNGILIDESNRVFDTVEEALTEAVSYALEFLKDCID